jgi:hypothetical protein
VNGPNPHVGDHWQHHTPGERATSRVHLSRVPMIKIIWSIQSSVVEPVMYRQSPGSSRSCPLPRSSTWRDASKVFDPQTRARPQVTKAGRVGLRVAVAKPYQTLQAR